VSLTAAAPHRAIATLALIGFLALSAAAATTGSLAAGPEVRTWYQALAAPPLAPPGWLFGPVWAVLYALMAVAAWRVWRVAGLDAAIAVYGLQLALNAAWSGLFFGLRRPGLAFAELAALWLAILATIVLFRRRDAVAAWLLAPYLAWVTFAGYLNAGFWVLSR